MKVILVDAVNCFTAEDVIYFEHGTAAMESAQSVGIKTYFYDHNKRDLAGLKQFIDQNL